MGDKCVKCMAKFYLTPTGTCEEDCRQVGFWRLRVACGCDRKRI